MIWINVLPESIVFNDIILPRIFPEKKITVIPDFYSYNPKNTNIAPDVIGIKTEDKIIPFVNLIMDGILLKAHFKLK